MDDERKKRVLADIDRVLAYQPSYGGTGAVVPSRVVHGDLSRIGMCG
jgi:hypothetical protein